MNELQIFKHESFGKVRVIEKEGEPWFYASDVARALGYERPNDAVNAHCKKVNKFSYGESPHPVVPYNIIPEADVYRLIMRSNLKEAVTFQDWFVEEVLPSIRKHGVYMTQQAAIDFIENPRELLRLVQAYADTKDKLAVAEEKIAIDASKVAFSESVMGGKELIGIGTLSKILGNHSPIDFGAIKLHEWMRDNGYTMYGKLGIEPTQLSKTNGWMQLSVERTPVGSKSCALVTWKGVNYFVGVFMNLEANGMRKLRSRKAPKITMKNGEVGVKCEEQKELQ
jgi:anti-repressor protein